MAHQKKYFTAYGFFDINLNLLRTVRNIHRSISSFKSSFFPDSICRSNLFANNGTTRNGK